MKKTLTIVAVVLLLASCARTQSGVSAGLIVTSWEDTIPGSINNSVSVSKRGEACAINALGIVAMGNSSIEEAKKSGGVKNIAFADTNYLNVLGIFQKGCTVVKGE